MIVIAIADWWWGVLAAAVAGLWLAGLLPTRADGGGGDADAGSGDPGGQP